MNCNANFVGSFLEYNRGYVTINVVTYMEGNVPYVRIIRDNPKKGTTRSFAFPKACLSEMMGLLSRA